MRARGLHVACLLKLMSVLRRCGGEDLDDAGMCTRVRYCFQRRVGVARLLSDYSDSVLLLPPLGSWLVSCDAGLFARLF